MAYDSHLYIYDPAVSASLWIGDSTQVTGSFLSKALNLPGVPLRGLNLNMVLNSVTSTPTMQVYMYEASTSGATTFRLFRKYPLTITGTGEYNMRFHLDKGFQGVKVGFSFSGLQNSSGCGFPGAIVRIGMDQGAWGNG